MRLAASKIAPAHGAGGNGALALDAVGLFEGVSPAQLGELARLLRPRRFAAGEAIVEAEEPGDSAFVVHAGFVRVQVTQADGAESILAILGPADVVGEMSVVDRLGRSATVVAHEPATLLALDRATFSALLQRVPTISRNLNRVLSRRLRLADAHIEALATLEVDGRIAHQLLAYAAEYGEPGPGGTRLPFHLTQGELAALVGASRVRVNQVLGDCKRLGYLSSDERHRITVRDPVALAAVCGASGAPLPGRR